MEIHLRINDTEVEVIANPGETLLTTLRGLGYFGAKHGCESGECGACTVLLDGRPVNSCVLLTAQAEGHAIETIEAVGQHPEQGWKTTPGLHPIQRAFVESGAIQCGYCTPAQVLAARHLLDHNPQPDEKDIPTALYYETRMDTIQPKIGESNEAVQLGLLKDIADPDLILIFCNPGTADILNRAYTYVSGEPVSGFGGNGACPFAIQYPYVTKKPSFTYSDVSWRKYVGMADDELTMSFPYQSLVQFIEYLPAVAEEYRHYGEMPGA